MASATPIRGFTSLGLLLAHVEPARAPRDYGRNGCNRKVGIVRKSPSRLFWERFRQDKVAIGGGVVLFLLVFIAIFGGPLAAHITGHAENAYFTNMTDEYGVPKGPNHAFWFGADAEGRDLFVRTMYGARTSLLVGVVASLRRPVHRPDGRALGRLLRRLGRLGALAHLRRGARDAAAPARDRHRSGLQHPGCLGGHLQPGIPVVIVVIAFFSWSYIARIVRGYTLSLREKEFVESARALGAGNLRILATEIFPNLVGPLIVYTTLLIPTNILFEAALSYLGLGVPQAEASWGGILTDASQLYDVAWWLMVFPGGFLILTTLAFNLLGDGLRDAFDVRTER